MRIGIVGSRTYKDLDFVRDYVAMIPAKNSPDSATNIIVSGGAKGVDKAAEEVARKNGLGLLIFKPNWAKFGRAAGPIRNKKIVENSDRIVAFWDGVSPGTKSTIMFAEEAGVPVEVFITRDE